MRTPEANLTNMCKIFMGRIIKFYWKTLKTKINAHELENIRVQYSPELFYKFEEIKYKILKGFPCNLMIWAHIAPYFVYQSPKPEYFRL